MASSKPSSLFKVSTFVVIAGLTATTVVHDATAQSFFDKAKETLGDALNSSGSGATSGGGSSAISALSSDTVEQGLKQALDVGVGLVTSQLGMTDGFNADPVAHIPLPDSLQNAQKLMTAAGSNKEKRKRKKKKKTKKRR